jgi:signal transduction histidine kinase
VTAYSVFKYRFIDIDVFIKRTLVFAGLFVFWLGITSLVMLVSTTYLSKVFVVNIYSIMALSILFVVGFYEPMRVFLVDLTDRFLFQRKYSYHKLLKENAKQISFIHSLDEVAKQISAFLIKQGRIKNAGMLVKNEIGHFELKYPLGYGDKTKRPKLSLPENHPVIQILKSRQSPLVFEHLEKEPYSIPHVSVTLEMMKFLKAEVLIPSFIGERSNGLVPKQSLRSILILGQKKSDEPYTDEDLDVFFTVAQDSAIAAERARLFDMVLKEREAKVLAEKKAEMVRYSTTIKHEIKNAVVGVKNAGMNAKTHFLSDIQKLLNQLVEMKLSAITIGLCRKIYDEIDHFTETVIRNGHKIFVIANTSSGLLKGDEAPREEISLKLVWDEAKHVAGQTPGVQNCHFSSSIPDDFSVFVKMFSLEQVLVNLITNASDAMQERDDKRIHLECSYRDVDGRKVSWCELSDNGQGINSNFMDKIFEEGFSTKKKPKRDDVLASGSGQGLYVCKKKIEEEHQGKIWVESELGKGTKFIFWIPFEQAITQKQEA